MVSYVFLEVNNILASNIVNEKNFLFRCDAGCRQCLKECEVNIFLLLSFEHVYQGLRGITTMLATCNTDYADYIT